MIMVVSTIILATVIWVGLIIAARLGYCTLLRKNTRRVTCKTCPKKAHCALFDLTGASKPCDPYKGPERRHTIRVQAESRPIEHA
jgi:hypothetical protein